MFGFFSNKSKEKAAPLVSASPATKKKGLGGFFSGICGDNGNDIVENKSPTAADVGLGPPPTPPPSMVPPKPPPPPSNFPMTPPPPPMMPPPPAIPQPPPAPAAPSSAPTGGSVPTPQSDGAKSSTPAEVLQQKLLDNKISLDEFDHMSEQLYASELSSSMPNPAWGTPETLPETLKKRKTALGLSFGPALTKESQAALQQEWTKKIQTLMDASIKEMNRPGLTNQEKAAVATKWLAVIQRMNRHTQKWLPDLENHLLTADVKVAEAEDYKLEHPEPDRTFFIGYDEDY